MSMRRVAAALLIGLSAASASSAGAFARGSDNGDGYLNDAQKNPRFIEPYSQFDPSRYRVSNPEHGYGDRERAAGYYGYEDRDVFAPFGRVEVAPYGRYYRP